jgi:hypothetical protein
MSKQVLAGAPATLEARAPSSLHPDRKKLLDRIVASQTFSRSARLRDLLIDIGEHTLSGHHSELHEQAIGVRVFGRENGYNPSEPREFKSGNFILTGSLRSNPWASLFESSLNFQFQPGKPGIQNVSPRRGEPSSFQAQPAAHSDPARIAVARNLNGAGIVLLIAGANIEGTEGAGDFALREDSLPLIRKLVGWRMNESIPSFEMILNITTLEGTARSAKIVAWRRH